MFGLGGMVGSVQIVPPTQSANFGHWGEARNIFAHKKVAHCGVGLRYLHIREGS